MPPSNESYRLTFIVGRGRWLGRSLGIFLTVPLLPLISPSSAGAQTASPRYIAPTPSAGRTARTGQRSLATLQAFDVGPAIRPVRVLGIEYQRRRVSDPCQVVRRVRRQQRHAVRGRDRPA